MPITAFATPPCAGAFYILFCYVGYDRDSNAYGGYSKRVCAAQSLPVSPAFGLYEEIRCESSSDRCPESDSALHLRHTHLLYAALSK